MKLYYLFDKKAKLPFHPRFDENVETELRNMSLEIRALREKNDYVKIAVFQDCELLELDLEKKEAKVIPEFRAFFSAPEKADKDDGKESK